MDIVQRIKAGDVRYVSRLIRSIEDELPQTREIIKELYRFTGNAFVIGLTGSPGAGKSTLSDALITNFRKQGKSIGVLAVDPTSPFSGGAILGDRVRMQKHAEDPQVFIRSLATRGALGGLSNAVDKAIHVLDAMGKEVILVETVGTGQSEVDIMNNAHSVVLVLTPGMGDEVQTIKAGIMEIADIFVINRADRKETAKLFQELQKMLDMANTRHSGWKPPIVKIKNVADPNSFLQEVDDLRVKLQEHRQVLWDKDILAQRERRKALVQLKNAFQSSIMQPLMEQLSQNGQLEKMLDALLQKSTDPYTLAEETAASYLRGSTRDVPDEV